MTKTSFILFCSAFAFLLGFLVPSAQAADRTWKASPGSALWNVNTNWVDDILPVSQDILFFGASDTTSLTNDFASNTRFNGMNFESDAPAYTFNGAQVQLGGNVTNNSTNLQTINFNVNSAGSQTRTFNTTAGGGDILFAGDAFGGMGINSGGTGVLILTGDNSAITNNWTVNEGSTMRISERANLGSDTLGVFRLNGTLDLRNDVGQDVSFTGKDITLPNIIAPTINVDRAVGGSGVNQTFTIGNLSRTNNSDGGLTVTGGNGYGLTTGSLTFNTLTNVRTITITNNAEGLLTTGAISADGTNTNYHFVFAGTGNTTVTGTLAPTDTATKVMTVTKNDDGVLSLNGSSSYRGKTTINAGTLLINGVNSDATTITGQGYGSASDGHFRIASGATLGGSGRIGGNNDQNNSNLILVDSGGFLAPGSSIGTLTLDGANLSGSNSRVLNMASGAEFVFELDANGGTPDQIHFWNYSNGDFLLNDNAINLTLLDAPGSVGTYTVSIFRFFADDGVNPVDSNILAGLTIGTVGANFVGIPTLDFNAGGNTIDLTYSVIPEPSSAALLLSLVGFAVIRRITRVR